jgi:Leucine-rich repeat (LRR) protein
MRYDKLNIFLIIFVLFGTANAQTTYVPDTNLRKMFKYFLPVYLDSKDYVVDAKAKTYTNSISIQNLNIKSLTGLWKFTGINSLACQDNQISDFDSLSKLTNLTSLYCFKNKITSIPDISNLTKLSYLSCGYNQISKMPDLSSNTTLTYLDCGGNQIAKLNGVDKLVELQSLYVFSNLLDSLPDLSKLTKLQVLACENNKIKTINGLDKLSQLTQLDIGTNNLDALPDLSILSKLNYFSFQKNNLEVLPSFDKMTNLIELIGFENKIKNSLDFTQNPNLTKIDLSNNLISSFPKTTSNNTKLRTLKFASNKIDSLPNFSLFTTLDTVYVNDNQLTFEDVIPLALNKNLKNLKYAPQGNVGQNTTIVLTERQAYNYVIGIDKHVLGNRYAWFKNGIQFAITNSDTLKFPIVQLSDSGTYSCIVTNELAPLLTLTSNEIKIKVEACIDLNKLTYTTTDYDCNFGGKLILNENSISGNNTPFSYKLSGIETGIIYYPNGTTFNNLFENSYSLIVSDASGCFKTYLNNILLKGKKGADCKSLVILDDNTQQNNTLLFDEVGIAKVFNAEGQLVHTFSTPFVWDGKNGNGEFKPGYYTIFINNKTLNVTLIK